MTGASGGLGSAIARYYAAPGTRLILWGRDENRLNDVADLCGAAGARVSIVVLDLTDTAAMLQALDRADAATPVDLAILVAGRGDIREAGALTEDPQVVAAVTAVNFTAPATLATALAGRMATRGGGRIALVGSAAAFHALPFATAYAGSKAGLARFAEGLRVAMKRHGVVVTLISPGFIDTAAGRAVSGPKPMLLSAEQAATRIARAIARKSPHLVMPWPFAILRGFDRLLPRPLRDRLLLALAPPGR